MKEHLHKILESLLAGNEGEALVALSEHLKTKSSSMLKEETFHGEPGYDEKQFVLPSSWAQYLTNGYEEHLSSEEIEAADAFMNEHGLMAPYSVSDEEKFTKKHDALQFWPKGERCATYTFFTELDPERLGFEPEHTGDEDSMHQLGDER